MSVRDVVDRMRFPPIVTVKVGPENGWGESVVSMSMPAADTTGRGPFTIRVECSVDGGQPAEAIAARLHQLCRNLFRHEVDEWVTYDGHPIIDPHPG